MLYEERNRFTVYVRKRGTPAYRDLERWRDWFIRRGIRAGIGSGPSGWAVYREGMTACPSAAAVAEALGISTREAEARLSEPVYREELAAVLERLSGESGR